MVALPVSPTIRHDPREISVEAGSCRREKVRLRRRADALAMAEPIWLPRCKCRFCGGNGEERARAANERTGFAYENVRKALRRRCPLLVRRA